MEIIVAFIQLYRENGKYLDRCYKWIDKVGLDWIKAQVVEDTENRAALVARFDHSQTIYQRDPGPTAPKATARASSCRWPTSPCVRPNNQVQPKVFIRP